MGGSSGRERHPSLILLGTVHTDPRGFTRTKAFLLQHDPDLVFVELSPFALKYRKEHAHALRRTLFSNLRTAAFKLKIEFPRALRNSRITAIIAQISLPFEYRASMAYAKRSGVEVLPVDDSEFSREWISTWPELLSAHNLENLLLLRTQPVPAKIQYQRAADRIAGQRSGADIPEGRDLALWQRREGRIAAGILSRLRTNAPRRPVYIGGWQHLLSGGRLKTIRDILKLEEPSCLLLDRSICKWQLERVASLAGKC